MTKNNFDNIENFKLIYNELIDARSQQQKDADMIYNKFNWLIVSNIAIIGILLQINNLSIYLKLSILSSTISLILCLISLKLKSFKRGPKLFELIETKTWPQKIQIQKLNEKILDAIEKNKQIIKYFANYLKYSIYSLIAGLLFIILDIAIYNINFICIYIKF